MLVPFGGDKATRVSAELAAQFQPGDQLIVVQDTGDLLHVPAATAAIAREAVDSAVAAFARMGSVDQPAVTAFYSGFARRLADDDVFGPIAAANAEDVSRARDRGRSTTRLELTDEVRADMIEGLEIWQAADQETGPVGTVEHAGWRVDMHRAGLGVIGFVFEGRPNVFADATGVLRSGNTVVFRIGSDALATARAIMTHAVEPSLGEAGLPTGAVSLVDSPERAAGWALFSDRRLGLAVARGSGQAVAQLGSVARQSGTPVSLHGTGGAWIVVSPMADPADVEAAVYHSLDRKVCNTLNTLAIVGPEQANLAAGLAGVTRAAARRGANPKLHVAGDVSLPPEWSASVPISRATGESVEPMAEPIDADRLGEEWEWEASPEVTLVTFASIEEAADAFNAQSPRFVVSLISDDGDEHDRFYSAVDAPFVGNGFTRWVDGQYALRRPELGLSNWQFGRLFGRGGILSGDGIFTIRTRVTQADPDVGR